MLGNSTSHALLLDYIILPYYFIFTTRMSYKIVSR